MQLRGIIIIQLPSVAFMLMSFMIVYSINDFKCHGIVDASLIHSNKDNEYFDIAALTNASVLLEEQTLLYNISSKCRLI